MHLRHLAINLLLATGTMARAQNWTGAVDSDWNNPANWTDWPLSGEDVTVDPALYTGAQVSPEITTASVFTPDRLYVINGAELVIEASLSVGNRVIIADGAQVEQGAGTLTTDRLVMELGGTFTLLNGTVNTLGVLAFGDDGAQPSLFTQNGGTVNANGELGFDLAVSPSAPRYVLNAGNLTVNGDVVWLGVAPGSGSGHLELNAGTVTVNGSLVNTVGSTADLRVHLNGGSLTTNGPGITLAHATDSIAITAGDLVVDGNVVLGNDGVLHATGGAVTFAQQAELRGTGTYRFHHLTIAAGASLLHTDPAEIGVTGDWTNSGVFNPGVGTVAFVGAGDQTVQASTFFGLRVANTGSGITLAGTSTVAGGLTLDQGLVNTSDADLLTLLDNATASPGSSLSHVNGPLRKIGNDAFVFPVGQGGAWRRIGIQDINDQGTEYTAAYFGTGPAVSTPLAPGLAAISTVEHWRLTRAVTADDARVALHWEDAAASGLSDCATLVVARWDGTAWQAEASTTTGSCAGNDAGSVESDNAVGSYTLFTFGTNDGTASVSDVDATAPFTLAPNPASDHLQLVGALPADEMQVLDALGRVMAPRITGRMLDVQGWPEGLYFLRTQARSWRFIVRH